jgi:hypothetical protein
MSIGMVRRNKQPKLSRKARFDLRQQAKDEQQRISRLVENYLARHQPDRFRLVVKSGAVMQYGDCWFVAVEPSWLEASRKLYETSLCRVEEEIERCEGIRVMLTSVLPFEDELEFEMPVLSAVRDLAVSIPDAEPRQGRT